MSRPDKKLKLTVNIVTCGRLELFKKCCQSVSRTLPPQSEVLVIVNGGHKATLDWLESWAPDTFRWEVVSRQSLARCRNRALTLAHGEFLYCLDDDVYVSPGLFDKAISKFEAFPKVSILGGPNITPPDSSLMARLHGAVMTSWFAAPGVRRRYGALSDSVKNQANEFDLMFCNLALRVDSIPANIRFEEHLRSNEENAFVNACAKRGLQASFFPELSVYHYRRNYLPEFLSQIASYGYGRLQQIRVEGVGTRLLFLIPGLCVIAIPTLLVLQKWELLVGLVLAHLILSLVATSWGSKEIRRLSRLNRTLLVPLTGLVHLAYGVGFCWALVRQTFSNQSNSVQPPVVESCQRFESA